MKKGRRVPGRIIGLTIQTLFRKPSTIDYPGAGTQPAVERNYRGQIKYDGTDCVGCRLCMKDCPTGALTITKAEDGTMHASVNLGRCIFCCQCVDSCHKKCLSFTQKVDLAERDKSKLCIKLDKTAGKQDG